MYTRVEFTGLAVQHKAVNLGQVHYTSFIINQDYTISAFQGFPDFAAPKYVSDALAAATSSTENCLLNQYTRSFVS